MEAAQGLQVVRLLGLLVERDHFRDRLLGSLHTHLRELIQRLFLVAHALEFACPGAWIVRIALTRGQNKAGGECADYHEASVSHFSTSLEKILP